ncbi:MAG: bifunctional 3-(3-hydroxy-phenyl)propionate/3-hydroxycinnamic acid hydroxylase [Gemmatimonadota bacterium]
MRPAFRPLSATPAPESGSDVLVVGLGPTGAVLALLLARAGVRVTVVEREPEVFPRPRAVFFDDEIMRVFQKLELIPLLKSAVQPVKGMDLVNAQGELLYRYQAPQGPGVLGWEEGFMFHQPELERILRAQLAKYPTVNLLLGHTVEAVAADAAGARVEVRGPKDHAMGARASYEVHASYVVGCDGARSVTREAMDAPLFDYHADAPWLVLDLLLEGAPDLPETTVQHCDPRRPSTFVPLPGGRCRFEFQVLPDDDPEAFSSADSVEGLLRPWLPPESYRVDRSAVYTFHGLVAESWQEGRVFLAGDAAHQMPPFLGQGMCAGIRDAVNLAWKLERVLSGAAEPALLESYQTEREPHVRQTVEVDLRLGGLIQTTDPGVARARDEEARSAGGGVPLSPPRFPLGPGLAREPDGAGVGLPFPQPILPDGDRLDEALGSGFALVGGISPTPETRAVLDRLGTRYLSFPPPPIRHWLKDQCATAALVRPDRLVLALVSDPGELEEALESLARSVSG